MITSLNKALLDLQTEWAASTDDYNQGRQTFFHNLALLGFKTLF